MSKFWIGQFTLFFAPPSPVNFCFRPAPPSGFLSMLHPAGKFSHRTSLMETTILSFFCHTCKTVFMRPKREQNCPNWGARGEGRLFGKDPNVNILLLLTSSLTHSRSTLTCTLSYFWYKRRFLSGSVSVKQLKG